MLQGLAKGVYGGHWIFHCIKVLRCTLFPFGLTAGRKEAVMEPGGRPEAVS